MRRECQKRIAQCGVAASVDIKIKCHEAEEGKKKNQNAILVRFCALNELNSSWMVSREIHRYKCAATVLLLIPIMLHMSNNFRDFMHVLLIWHTAINAAKFNSDLSFSNQTSYCLPRG